ncbi:HDOD domain-containing protein [uncultured Neptuniibacter sp.]|uniref:HDOD domain-containing protein n=1 Tax=uncultured Neptuniibacter sp. TaxID=502143 RepID=UPI002617FD26|nr:HDOD domain-containing protein [uncultured Neptuniibacter sp.]
MEISELLKQTDKLPNVPDVVRQLIQQLNNPAADYGEIAEKVSQDQTLSLKILRLVNSAHFGLTRKVSSLDQAVIMLGMTRLKTLVIATGLASSVKEIKGLDLKAFWKESFRIAALSKWFAQQNSNVDPDIAFTAGLIHNIGTLLIYLATPEAALQVQKLVEETACEQTAAEKHCLGFSIPEAGQALLDMWNFPSELGIAALQCQAPLSYEKPSELAAVIHLAHLINDLSESDEALEKAIEQYPHDVAELANIKLESMPLLEEALKLESGLDGLLS